MIWLLFQEFYEWTLWKRKCKENEIHSILALSIEDVACESNETGNINQNGTFSLLFWSLLCLATFCLVIAYKGKNIKRLCSVQSNGGIRMSGYFCYGEKRVRTNFPTRNLILCHSFYSSIVTPIIIWSNRKPRKWYFYLFYLDGAIGLNNILIHIE